MKNTKKYYIAPEAAMQKIQQAKKTKQPVYIYAAIGYGKTEFITNYFEPGKYIYVSCKDDHQDFSCIDDQGTSGKGRQIVVIDDVWMLNNQKLQQSICALAGREDIWLIMIGRSAMPSWLLAAYVKYNIMVISENDMRLTRKEIAAMCELYEIELSEDRILYLEKSSRGNGYTIRHTFMELANGAVLDEELSQKIRQMFVLYMEKNLLTSWDSDLLEFLFQISVVDEFDLPLAEFITGNSKVAMMIEKAQETGNFLEKTGERYRIRPELLLALRSTAQKQYGLERMKEYMYNAGLYYETRDQLVDALNMYEQSGNSHRVHNLLTRSARQNPAAGFYFELRKYYLRLTEEEVSDSPVLMSALSMLYSMLLQPEESEHWYQKVKECTKSENRNLRKEAVSRLAYLDIGLPHRGTKSLVEIILQISKLMVTRDFQLPEFSLTSNLPGVMNGGKDFSEWSKRDKELALLLGKPVTMVLGKYGKGLVNEALGESFFEKKENDFEAFSYLSKALMEAENGGKLELQFAIVGLQTRMSLVHGDLAMAKNQLASFEKKISKEESKQMWLNLYAMYCRLDLYENDIEKISKWMQEAPDENEVFFVMERYRYLTKVRCYILQAEYYKGLSLLERLRYFAEICVRPYLQMEVDILEAIIRRRMGEEWEEIFLRAIEKTKEYHFVRILSQEGAAILPLLKDIRKKEGSLSGKEKEWWKKVYEEAEKISRYYPGYLNAEEASSIDFSDNAIQILRYQAEGMTIRQIASAMGLAETTIKYHATETYKKLNVKGKTDAVQKAKALKII